MLSKSKTVEGKIVSKFFGEKKNYETCAREGFWSKHDVTKYLDGFIQDNKTALKSSVKRLGST